MYGQINSTGTNPVLGHSRGNGVLQLAHNANLSCLLATADSELALKTHFLYEVGGNIGVVYSVYFVLKTVSQRNIKEDCVITNKLWFQVNVNWNRHQ